MLQAKLGDILRSPSSLLAIIGLALITLGREAHRYPVLASVENIGFLSLTLGPIVIPVATLITIAALIAFFLILNATAGKSRVFSFVPALLVALIMSAGYLGKFQMFANSGIDVVLRICSEFTQACGFFILISWSVMLYRNERDRLLILVAYSFLLAGIVQALLAVTLPEVGIVLCTFTPVFSVLLLRLYRFTYDQEHAAFTPGAATVITVQDAAQESPDTKPGFAAWMVVLCVICYGVICFVQSQTWLSSQQYRLAPLLVQLFSALGSILAAIVLIALVRRDFNVMNEIVYKIVIFAIFAVSVFVSSFAQSHNSIGVFTTFVDAGYKFILLFIWLYPLLAKSSKPDTVSFAGLHLAYFVGVSIAVIAQASPTVEFVVIVVGLVFLMVDAVRDLMAMVSQPRSTAVIREASSADEDTTAEQLVAAETAEAEQATTLAAYRRMLFMVYISETFHFTQRELEVFPYFLQGTKTKDIAQTLYISQETVRTHRRNIYQKLDVSSSDELKEKAQKLREEDFPTFLEKISSMPATDEF